MATTPDARKALAASIRAVRTRLLSEGRAPEDAAALLLARVAHRMAVARGLAREEAVRALPGLLAQRPPTPAGVESALDDPALAPSWDDPLTLGWALQACNDPDREALDAKVAAGGKIEPHEIATKTQTFTERYMVDWLLHNSLGPLWLGICARNGWVAEVEADGTLERLEARRARWRQLREAGEVARDALMPLHTDAEGRWASWLPQPLPPDAAERAPDSIREVRLIDPAVGAGHFLVVALGLLVALHREEARHRGLAWEDAEIVQWVVEHTLHGVDLDPRAVRVAAASLWLEAHRLAPGVPLDRMNLVASAHAGVEGAAHLGSLLRPGAGPVGPTPVDDLGVRLGPGQHPAGRRFVELVREDHYHLVVGNPPYQGTVKLADAAWVKEHYPRGRADLYAAFMERSLQLAREGGTVAVLTMRGWMFLDHHAELRAWLLDHNDLRALGDLEWGAFADMKDVKVVMSVFRRAPPSGLPAVAVAPTGTSPSARTAEVLRQKVAGLRCASERYDFDPAALAAVPGRPLLYWWGEDTLRLYRDHPPLAEVCTTRRGATTGSNARFVRKVWELAPGSLVAHRYRDQVEGERLEGAWVPYLKGAAGRQWIDSLTDAVRWADGGRELRASIAQAWGEGAVGWKLCNGPWDGGRGVAYSTIGSTFRARVHRYHAVVDVSGATLVPGEGLTAADLVCWLNTTRLRGLVADLNPSVNFQLADLKRAPWCPVPGSEAILERLDAAFAEHERHRAASVEFTGPGPSPWRGAQAWAQDAVDRPAGAPLPAYTEVLDPEPPEDHLEFALGVALGRLGPGGEGVLDPRQDDLTHALPAGILFVDGTLGQDGSGDGLDHPAAAPLWTAWRERGPALHTASLRDWLRLDAFAHHRAAYAQRPIHWPLSSSRRTFVAWVGIHRWDARTLHTLLEEHLRPALARHPGPARAELLAFAAEVEQCATRGPVDPECPPREVDAPYAPVLDDGVVVNAAALWPLLAPQWREPRRRWRELATARGRKHADWSHLAARYWPARVAARRAADPSVDPGAILGP